MTPPSISQNGVDKKITDYSVSLAVPAAEHPMISLLFGGPF